MSKFVETTKKITRGQRHLAKATPCTRPAVYTACPAADLSRVTDRLTDTTNIGKNSQHLMHSMQPNNVDIFIETQSRWAFILRELYTSGLT